MDEIELWRIMFWRSREVWVGVVKEVVDSWGGARGGVVRSSGRVASAIVPSTVSSPAIARVDDMKLPIERSFSVANLMAAASSVSTLTVASGGVGSFKSEGSPAEGNVYFAQAKAR